MGLIYKYHSLLSRPDTCETMASLVYFVFLCFINLTMCKDCVIDNRVKETSWEYKLLKDLLTDYSYSQMINPGNCTETLKVGVQFALQNFRFLSNEEVFQMYGWVFLTWYDYRLKWNSSDYGGIDKLTVTGWNIWTPGFKLFNSADEDDLGYFTYLVFAGCHVHSNGLVQCIPRVTHQTGCSTKLADWPYDTQKCSLHFGEFRMPGPKLVYTFNGTKGVSMIGAEYGSGWTIVDYERKENPNSTVQLTLTFEVEREAAGLAAIIMVPAIIVCILNLTSLVLEGTVRIGVIFFSILLHFSLIQEISETIPKQSWDTPLVLLHARSSLFLTIFVCMLTFFLSFLRKRVVPPPVKVTAIIEYMYNGYMKYIILHRQETGVERLEYSEDLNVHKKAMDEWSDFANIVNSVCLIVFTIVYFCLFVSYMPKALQSIVSRSFY